MSWRIVVISNTAKLDFRLNYLVIRGAKETKIHLGEISQIIIESTAVSLTSALLCELNKRKIKVVFCDEKRLPHSELVPYYGSHDTSGKIREQIKWDDEIKQAVWGEIIKEKIAKQKEFLEVLGKAEAELLEDICFKISSDDKTNREGYAAKVYFSSVFGSGFTREDSCPINASLNYGYSILLSAFSREIVSNGYITQIGLFHDNQFNNFNLASDLMEPFRPIVDRLVFDIYPMEFTTEVKHCIADVLNENVIIDETNQVLNNAIKIYTKSVLDALSDRDISKIRFFRNEL